MADPLAAAFPTRPLRITARIPRWKSWLLGVLGLLLIGGGAVAVTWDTLPTLLSDHEIHARAIPLAKVNVVNGRCRVRGAVLNTCDLTLTLPARPGAPAVQRKVSYVFFDFHSGSREVVPMGDPARPELMTTDLGLAYWTNRLLTLIGLAGLGVVLALTCAALPFIAGRQRRALAGLSGRVLTPEPVRLKILQGQWTVTPAGGGAKHTWQLGNAAQPFWVDPKGGIALGVTAPGGALFPLDEDLNWLDLTPKERASLQTARTTLHEGAGN